MMISAVLNGRSSGKPPLPPEFSDVPTVAVYDTRSCAKQLYILLDLWTHCMDFMNTDLTLSFPTCLGPPQLMQYSNNGLYQP